jgi:hypothetical protein
LRRSTPKATATYDGKASLADHHEQRHHLLGHHHHHQIEQQVQQQQQQQQQQQPQQQQGGSSSSSHRRHHLTDRPTGTQVHIQALDEIVSVNSFFTVAVFIGLSFTSPTAQATLVSTCIVDDKYRTYLLILEVVAFSSYLMSSLIAQGLKLLIVLVNGKDHPDQSMSAQINPRLLRIGMLLTAFGTVVGTMFLTSSMVVLIQIRLGHLICSSNHWSKWAIVPMVTMVFSGLLAFMSAALFAFVT